MALQVKQRKNYWGHKRVVVTHSATERARGASAGYFVQTTNSETGAKHTTQYFGTVDEALEATWLKDPQRRK